MKKILVVTFLIAAILTTGCLGDAPTQIVGTWKYVPVDPTQDVMFWTFTDDGIVYYYDATTSQLDTGNYEMYMVGTHKMVKVTGTTIEDNNLPMAGEWTIVDITSSILRIGIKVDPGGFFQRDLTKQ